MFILGVGLPLIFSILVGGLGRFLGFHGVRGLLYLGTIIPVIINCLNLKNGINDDIIYVKLGTLIYFNTVASEWSFQFDNLVNIMILMVTVISGVVQIYSTEYMRYDPHIVRFLTYLNLFTFFMLFFVSANSIIQLFIGWEGVGVCSYLLINFWFTRIQANKSAIKAMIMNKVGDSGLILGVVLLFVGTASIEFSVIFLFEDLLSSQLWWDGIQINLETWIGENNLSENFWDSYNNDYTWWNILLSSTPEGGILYPISYLTNAENENLGHIIHATNFLGLSLIISIFLGVMSKSAQLGLHMWLPDAMEGPTPVSALIHAATMVTAGIFAFLRLSQLFSEYPYFLNFVVVIGTLTALFSALTAVSQIDIKKIIAYSTCSQLGYMVVALGLTQHTTGFFHLINHAFFKALLFLTAGSVIHILSDDQDIRTNGNLGGFAPITYILLGIGTLAIIGIPFLTGYYSKDAIIETAYLSITNDEEINSALGTNFGFTAGIITAALTTLYSTKIVYYVFIGQTRVYKIQQTAITESSWKLLIPLFILSAGSLFIGFTLKDAIIGAGNSIFTSSINTQVILNTVNCEFIPNLIKWIPTLTVFGILIMTMLLYHEIPQSTIWLKYFFLKLLNLWSYNIHFNKYTTNISKNFLKISFDKVFANLDKGLWEKLGPTGVTKIVKLWVNLMIRNHNKSIYEYVATSIVVLFAMFSVTYISELSLDIFNSTILSMELAGNSNFNHFFETKNFLINTGLGVSVIGAVLCFWTTRTQPILNLGFFLLIIIPNIFILFLLGLEYLAIILLIIYAGAIVILFIFVLLVCDPRDTVIGTSQNSRWHKSNSHFFYKAGGFGIFLVTIVIIKNVNTELSWFNQLTDSYIRYNLLPDYLFLTNMNYDLLIFGEILLNYLPVALFIISLILFIIMLGTIIITTLTA